MEDEKIKDEALRFIGLFEVLPRLVVFDLDYTLWPFYCEMSSKKVMPSLYPHAKGILHALQEKGVQMALLHGHLLLISPTHSSISSVFRICL
ncbi:hypothetical protein KSP39_PZI018143 [Platanthera zijinensis]|uniref:Magnesium-dependent phosphatase 1 n=1 Tax=Platanthera zijinensis TaxID=2320716 RepID=A0AAP0B5K7_9ASPA